MIVITSESLIKNAVSDNRTDFSTLTRISRPSRVTMESTRLLLEGERVEVRQKEMGLRGSWHCGVVVQVKPGRRVVEYDELFKLDGSKKLRECIPLTEQINVQCPAPQHRTSLSANHDVRGFIRPIPPPCLFSVARKWKKGLLVDAFYDHAWWEGILLHDMSKKNEASRAKIFFPDEGDELCCYAKDVRVSQEWDEGSSQWVVRGIWPFGGDNGELDIDRLRIISRKQNSSLKKLWRQRNVCALASLEAKVKNSSLLFLEHQGCNVRSGAKLSPNGNGLSLLSDGQRFSSASEGKQSTSTGSLRVQEGDASNRLEKLGRERGEPAPQANCLRSMKGLMKNSQSAAKKFLVDSGWKIFVRTRTQGATQGMKEAVYRSPNGSKYYSLASACRSWKKLNNLSGSLEGLSQRVKLLDAYSLAEQFTASGKGFMRRNKTKTGQPGDRCKSKAGGGVLRTHSNSVVNVKSRKSAKSSGTQTRLSKPFLPAINITKSKSTVSTEEIKKRKFAEEQTEQKRSKSMPFAEKSKKRKCNEEGMVQKCKKGRPYVRNQVFLQDDKASRGRGGWKMQVLLSSPRRQSSSLSGHNRTETTHIKRSSVLSWLIDRGIIRDNEPVSYLSRRDGHVMKKGEVTREGVLCKCCNDVFTLSNFEAHAGSKLHRPSANTFLDDGRSITDCQLQSCALQDAKVDNLADASDDTCGVCADGGELILCDNCPSTFHPNCVGLEVVPDDEWYCPRCLCEGCSQNKMAGDGAGTLTRCYQCELRYHSVCAPESLVLKPVHIATGTWFCGHKCEQLFTDLRELVGKANLFGDGFCWKLLRSMKDDLELAPSSLEVMAEHNVKLGVAHDVMQECFIPMVDPRTKIDLISQALYNRKSKVLRLDYGGFYTIILEKGDEMISVAAVRVHGCRLAEMPLVGTRYQYRRQGMCRRLMQALEQMLGSIGVEKLVLPAVPELLETWTGAFSFQLMSAAELHELRRLSLMTFPGTTFLQKRLEGGQSEKVANPQLNLPEKAGINDRLASDSAGNPMAASGMSLDACLSDTQLSMGCSQRDSQCGHDHTEGFQKPTSLDLKCPTPPRLTLDGLLSKSSCDDSNEEQGRRDDEIQYARVVRATTLSKRLVKSSKWVADGVQDLAKDIEESSCEARNSMHKGVSEGLNLTPHMLSESDEEKKTTVVVSTDSLGADRTDLNMDAAPGPSNSHHNHLVDPLMILSAEAGFVYSSNYYVRRGRKKQQEGEIDPASHICEGPLNLVQSKVE